MINLAAMAKFDLLVDGDECESMDAIGVSNDS